MSAMVWVSVALFVVATAGVYMRTLELYRALDAGPRTRRLLSQRAITAAGCWQLTIGGLLILMPGGSVTSAIPVTGCGLMMVGMSRFWRKVGLP